MILQERDCARSRAPRREVGPVNWTGIAIVQVSSVMIMETGAEDLRMRRKHRNHSASFKAKVAVGAARRSVRGTRPSPGKIIARLAAPVEVPALLPATLVSVVWPHGSFEEHS